MISTVTSINNINIQGDNKPFFKTVRPVTNTATNFVAQKKLTKNERLGIQMSTALGVLASLMLLAKTSKRPYSLNIKRMVSTPFKETFLGKDGGYQLRSQIELPSILFNQYDIEIIDNVIKNCSNEEELQNLINLKQKIVHYCKLINNDEDFLEKDKRQILDDIKESIIEQQSIKIEYYSKGLKKQRVISPTQTVNDITLFYFMQTAIFYFSLPIHISLCHTVSKGPRLKCLNHQ